MSFALLERPVKQFSLMILGEIARREQAAPRAWRGGKLLRRYSLRRPTPLGEHRRHPGNMRAIAGHPPAAYLSCLS